MCPVIAVYGPIRIFEQHGKVDIVFLQSAEQF